MVWEAGRGGTVESAEAEEVEGRFVEVPLPKPIPEDVVADIRVASFGIVNASESEGFPLDGEVPRPLVPDGRWVELANGTVEVKLWASEVKI